jgi:hypothetical protein
MGSLVYLMNQSEAATALNIVTDPSAAYPVSGSLPESFECN